MPIEDDADLALFMDSDDFGVSVTYTPLVGQPSTFSALLLDQPADIVISGAPAADGRHRLLVLRTADVAIPVEADQVSIGGTTYKVVPPIHPDGHGLVTVTLEATT
jgi:hypothetical protein